MIKAMKELARQAEQAYKDSVKAAIKATIRETLKDLKADTEKSTYYAELMTAEQAEVATDEQFNEYDSKSRAIEYKLNQLEQELIGMLEQVDEWCTVSASLFSDNSIGVGVEVDGIEFEMYLENTYNK